MRQKHTKVKELIEIIRGRKSNSGVFAAGFSGRREKR